MNKEQFLSSSQINSFITWFSKPYLAPNGFLHKYKGTSKTLPFKCTNIENSVYRWPFQYNDPITGEKVSGDKNTNYEVTKRHLDHLSELLRDAYHENNELKLARTWKAIYEWGGVSSKAPIKGHFDKLAKEGRLQSTLANLIKQTKEFQLNTASREYIDSGLTKVYALFEPSLIIYDSRVSAALCYLIRLYCEENQLASLPDALHFYSLENKSYQKEKNRNASTANYKFKLRLDNTSGQRFEDTIKASWLIEGIITKHKNPTNEHELHSAMRELEANLFMIGYHVPLSPNDKKIRNSSKNKDKAQKTTHPLDFDKALKLKTLGKGKKAVPFYVQILEDEVHFYEEDEHDKPALRVSKDFLKLATSHFKDKGVILAGLSANAPAKGGWGEWIKAQSPSQNVTTLQPPHGSKILSFLYSEQCIDYEYRSGALVITVTKIYQG